MKPQRIQRIRGKKFSLPHTKAVDRTSRWGNPFKPGDEYGTTTIPEAIEKHKTHLMAGTLPRIRNLKPATVEAVRKELKGWNLACCAPGNPCHGDTLLKIQTPKNKTPQGGQNP